MKANIPGEREGMYMATDSMFVDVEDIVVKGEYAQEARGLWEMEGDMMGGPLCLMHGWIVLTAVSLWLRPLSIHRIN